MSASRSESEVLSRPNGLVSNLPVCVAGLSTAYALALSYAERRLPLKPDHIWAEVAGGVVISLVPVALAARRGGELSWQSYESAVWRSFVACGAPIILWQIGETLLRQAELVRYRATQELKSLGAYADDTSAVAI